MPPENRWEQRLENFSKALKKMVQAVAQIKQNAEFQNPVLEEMIKEGLIQRFEYTHELAWNVMKDYAQFQGNNNIGGSRDATQEAFNLKLITDGKNWMDMIKSRNKTSHTYNEETATEIYDKILEIYYPLFLQFGNTMEAKRTNQQGNLL